MLRPLLRDRRIAQLNAQSTVSPCRAVRRITYTAVDRIGVASAYMTNVTAAPTAASSEQFGLNSNPQTPVGPILVPATGFGFAFVFGRSATVTTPGPNALTWTNATSSSGDIASSMLNPYSQVGAAHTATSGSWTPTVSDAGSLMPFAACMSTIAVGP
jgi:hypothetical protein